MMISTSALIVLLSVPLIVSAADDYTLGPDSMPREGVPKGRIEGPLVFKSRTFANTVRPSHAGRIARRLKSVKKLRQKVTSKLRACSR